MRAKSIRNSYVKPTTSSGRTCFLSLISRLPPAQQDLTTVPGTPATPSTHDLIHPGQEPGNDNALNDETVPKTRRSSEHWGNDEVQEGAFDGKAAQTAIETRHISQTLQSAHFSTALEDRRQLHLPYDFPSQHGEAATTASTVAHR